MSSAARQAVEGVRQPNRRNIELGLLVGAWLIGTFGTIQVAWATTEGMNQRLWITIGAVVILAVTGAEALYADMGHFGLRPIRLAWAALIAPSLVLCYLGQAAVVIKDPEAASDPFFSMAPNPSFALFMVILSTAATVIASQALITGVFSLSRQAVQLGLILNTPMGSEIM